MGTEHSTSYPFNEAVKIIKRTHYKIRKNSGYAFGIVLKEINRVIGVVDIFNVDWKNESAEIGYWIGRKYWNRGLMTEAIRLILKFAFEELKLHRVSATTMRRTSPPEEFWRKQVSD